jgi:excisionase family DNA binding protein
VTSPDRRAGERRFLQVADVAEVLSMKHQHVLALLRRGEIRGVQVGGRGQWRGEDVELDAYIDRLYAPADQTQADQTQADQTQAGQTQADTRAHH